MIRTNFEAVVAISAIMMIIAAVTHAAVSQNGSVPYGVSGEITSSIPK